MVTEVKYDEIKGTFYSVENIAAVRIGKKWSVINSDGIELLDFKYTHIWPSKDSSLATLQTYSSCEVVDVLTHETICNSGQYDCIEGFRFGFARIKKNGMWGLINSAGKQVLPAQYVDMFDFFSNWDKPETKVRKTEDAEWEYINLKQFDKR